jgi:2-keto-3-deoxy-L-rhamnonate aldolase RhmA
VVRPNNIKRALKENKLVIGTMVTEFRSPGLSQMLANAGFDFISVDSEHSRFSLETVSEHIIGARAAGISSVVRIPEKGLYHLISRVLDSGAQGIIVPQVDTPEDVRFVVQSAKFAPVGMRGTAFRRAFTDYSRENAARLAAAANDESLIIIQAESLYAVEHLDELLDAGPVDAVMVGPNDLSQSLGILGQTGNDELAPYIQKVVDTCARHGVASGIALRSPDAIRRWVDAGMRFIVASTDISIFADAAEQLVTAIRA